MHKDRLPWWFRDTILTRLRLLWLRWVTEPLIDWLDNHLTRFAETERPTT